VKALMDDQVIVTRIGDGAYRVEREGRNEIVYVAGPPGDTWVFWNGRIFRGSFEAPAPGRPYAPRGKGTQSLTAPMPATVIKVLVQPGAAVKKGDTIIILEAMKMELPIRAPADATVAAVHCRDGDLVQPETTLVDLV
jgi:acetyl/propionyl-CoA carboxylase alpha subunit